MCIVINILKMLQNTKKYAKYHVPVLWENFGDAVVSIMVL